MAHDEEAMQELPPAIRAQASISSGGCMLCMSAERRLPAPP